MVIRKPGKNWVFETKTLEPVKTNTLKGSEDLTFSKISFNFPLKIEKMRNR